jgi:hypothetical protein
MSTAAPTALEPECDEIFENLHSRWMDNVKEIGERLTGLRDAMVAGWRPDEQSETNLGNLCKNFEQNAFCNMGNVRTVLLCAEYNALAFLPNGRARANEICLALTAAAAESKRPTPEEMAKFAEDMRAGCIPMPGGSVEPSAPQPRQGFGGHVIPFRTKSRRKF